MAINVTKANQQAAEIASRVGQLRSARSSLVKYKSELQANWQGQEVGLFVQSADITIAKIDALIGSLNTLSSDIRNAASAIQREEKAAEEAAAANAARQQRLTEARNAYNASCNALDAITKERQALVEQMRNTKSLKTMTSLNKQLVEIDKRLAAAQEECNRCRSALDMAGR